MKLPKSVQIKETTGLFAGKYNFKIVLICSVAFWFRNKNYDHTLAKLNEVEPEHFEDKWSRVKSPEELKYCYKLLNALKGLNEDLYQLRIENPRLSVYTNEPHYIEKLAALGSEHVKFVCMPSTNLQQLEPGKIVVKRLDFGYKVHLATIKKRNHSNFIEWAEQNKKVRLTKRCKKDLTQDNSWGGSYFYVKDEKTMTMVKMFLGADISRIEQVIKA